MREYQMCKRCVMDTSAQEITFDSAGVCSFCRRFDRDCKPILDRARSGKARKLLAKLVENIKKSAHGRPYDSVLGISGGTDSSYLAYLVAELGLRPLVVHVDTGWNSPESESNIKHLVSRLGFALEVIALNREEMRDLVLAFYRASVKNCEIPQDHTFLAALYRKAAEIRVHYILSGGNLATESVLPKSWGFNTADLLHLTAIHRRFGTAPIKSLPTMSFYSRYIYYPFVCGISEVRLLNFVSYNKAEAKRILTEKFGWQDYGTKHYESVLTRFFQGYYLPTKFGIDKRKAHLSSLILSGQITREAALEELKKPPYQSEKLLQADKRHIARQLGLSLTEWEEILALPPRKHEDFPSAKMLFAIKDMLAQITGIRRRRSGISGQLIRSAYGFLGKEKRRLSGIQLG